MIRSIGRAIYLERKRLLFVATLAFLGGVLLYANMPVFVYGIPLPLITGLAYAALVTPVAMLICVFLPSFRFMVEAVAISRFLVALLAFTVPSVGLTLVMSPLLLAIIVVGGGIAVSRLLHGHIIRPQKSDPVPEAIPVAHRRPARLAAPTPFQRRFVGWLDDVEPVAV